jgi:hypothetical protein
MNADAIDESGRGHDVLSGGRRPEAVDLVAAGRLVARAWRHEPPLALRRSRSVVRTSLGTPARCTTLGAQDRSRRMTNLLLLAGLPEIPRE